MEKMVETNLEGVGVLVGLGLSVRQARVYLVLLKAGRSRAYPVAYAAGVPRQEAYSLLIELQQLGLVKQYLTAPKTYSAAPFPEAAKILFERRTSELTLMSKKAEKLTAQLSQTPPAPLSIPPCFGMVCEAEGGRQHQRALTEIQNSIEGVFSWIRFKQFCTRFETELQTALKRDVALRFITQKPAGHNLPKWITTPELPKYRFELRTLHNPPDATIILFDTNLAAIAFDKNTSITKGTDLWSTHPGIIAVCQAYFYRTWGHASQ